MMIKGHLPKLFSEKQTEFRNKVTHQGFFPKENDTLMYAKAVAEFIISVIEELTDGFKADKLGSFRFSETVQNNNQINKEMREKGLPSDEIINGHTIFSFFRNHHYSKEGWFDCMLKEFRGSYGDCYDA